MRLVQSNQPTNSPLDLQQFSPTVAEPSLIDLTIMVPVFNEYEMLEIFHNTLVEVLSGLTGIRSEVLYINDGSSDGSWALMQSLSNATCDVVSINLSRNFGKEAAMSAGFEHMRGDAVIILDADLQDPPALIPQMISQWRKGFDVVNMQRSNRLGESWFKRSCAHLFYRLLDKLSDAPIAKDVGDFRLLTRQVVETIKQMPERNRYMKGIMSWPGFRQTTLSFERPARVAGETKWSFIQLVGLAWAGITGFSAKPLRLATWLGGLVSLGALAYGVFIFTSTLIFGETVAGYPSMMLTILWLGGVQLLGIGLLGEYVGLIFTEAKARPLYIVMEKQQLAAQCRQASNG